MDEILLPLFRKHQGLIDPYTTMLVPLISSSIFNFSFNYLTLISEFDKY